MAELSISEASRLSGKSTQTLYRWIGSGRVSATIDQEGHKRIESSELARVVALRHLTEKPAPGPTARAAPSDSETLKAQIETLERLLQEKDARIEELRADKRELQARLEHIQPSKSAGGLISSWLSARGL